MADSRHDCVSYEVDLTVDSQMDILRKFLTHHLPQTLEVSCLLMSIHRILNFIYIHTFSTNIIIYTWTSRGPERPGPHKLT